MADGPRSNLPWELDEDDLRPPEQGEQRIRPTSAGIFVFAVSRIAQDRVWLRPVGAKRGAMPPEGRLQVDTVAQRRAIERQEESLSSSAAGKPLSRGSREFS